MEYLYVYKKEVKVLLRILSEKKYLIVSSPPNPLKLET